MCKMFLAFLLCWIFVLVNGDIHVCWQPDPVPNAYRTFIGYPHLNGTRMLYECYENYAHTYGNLDRMCINGAYAGNTPSCELQCGVPKGIQGAVLYYGSSGLGSVASYECNTDGSVKMEAVCRDNGRWEYNDYFPCDVSTNLLVTMNSSEILSSNLFRFVVDGDISTSVYFGPDNPVGFHINLEDYDKYFDVYQYTIRLDGVVDPQLKSIHFCLWSVSNFFPSGIICADTLIVGSPTDLVIDEHLPCCFFANIITIEGEMNSGVGFLNISEVELYARPRTINCGQPDFVYGAVTSTDDVIGHIKRGNYQCKNGFFTTRMSEEMMCSSHNNWVYSNQQIKCEDHPVLKLNTSTHPLLFDNSDTTCEQLPGATNILMSFRNGQIVEVETVTIRAAAGENMTGLSIRSLYNGQETVCSALEDTTSVKEVLTFTCDYTLSSELLFHKPGYNWSSTINVCEIRVIGREWNENPLECYRMSDANDYKGYVNYTISGKDCDPWLGVDAHHQNYCRALNASRPWCYTNSYNDWEYCPVVECRMICAELINGYDYIGELGITRTGGRCRNWGISDEYNRIFSELAFPDSNRNQSYCRNPGKSQDTAWCYTVNTNRNTFAPCTVPQCPLGFYTLQLTNTSAIDIIHLQYLYLWDLTTGTKIEKYNTTIDLDRVEYYCSNNIHSNLYGYTSLIYPNWIRIRITCITEDPFPKYINSTSCEQTSSTLLLWDTSSLQSSFLPVETTLLSGVSDITSVILPTSITQPLSYNTMPTVVSTSAYNTNIETSYSSSSPIEISTTITTVMDIPFSTAVLNSYTSSVPTIAIQYTTSLTLASSEFNDSDDCACLCMDMDAFNISKEVLQGRIENISKVLYIDTATLSSKIRKLTSAEDPRPSATYVGSAAIFIFSMTFIMIVIPDIINVFRYLNQKFKPDDEKKEP